MQLLPAGWDARYFQLIFQSIFLGYGLLYLHWSADWWLYATYFLVSICTHFLFEVIKCRHRFMASYSVCMQQIGKGLPSVWISSFGLVLLLKTNHLYVAALAAFVAISSKYILRLNGKHIFNPSALGIAAAVVLTGKAWFSPGQWGSGAVLSFAGVCLGVIVVTRVQHLDVSLAFAGTFAALLFIRQIVFLQWPLDYFFQSISTGSLLLFSFFMITDPKTTPNHPVARMLWAMLIAAVSFYLTTFRFINGAPVWALLFAQPLVPLLDGLFKSKKFEWHTKPHPVQFSNYPFSNKPTLH